MDDKICVRISKELRGSLDSFAKERNSRISAVARQLIEHGIRDRHFQDIEMLRQQTNDLLIQVRRIGVNINQIAYHLNANGHHDSSDISQEFLALRMLLDSTSKLLRHVSHELST